MKNVMKRSLAYTCLIALLFTAPHCGKSDKTIDPPGDEQPDPNPNPDPGTPTGKDTWTEYSTTAKQLGADNWSFAVGTKVYFGKEGSDKLQVYDITGKQWETEISLPDDFTPRYGPHLTVLDNRAYIGGGGTVGGLFFADWWEFEPAATTKWKALAVFEELQEYGRAFVFDGKLYSGLSFGIIGGGVAQNQFHRYDIASNTWNLTPIYNNTLCGSRGFGFLLNNEYYFGAGYEDDILHFGETKKCYRLAPAAGTVQAIADFPENITPKENAVAFTANGKGYVLKAGSFLYQYDPAENKWAKMKQTPNEGGIVLTYVHQTGDKVYGFTTTGKVFQYTYK